MRDRLRFSATPSDGSFRCRGCSDRQRAELPQESGLSVVVSIPKERTILRISIYKYFAVWPIPAVGQRLDGHSQPGVESSLQQNTDEPFTSRSLTLTERVSTLG